MKKGNTHFRYRFLSVILVGFVLCGVLALPVAAYFNLGQISVSLGQTSVSVAAGSRVTVSATPNPGSSMQTVGCGAEQCPQACPANCRDANGQCTCGGTWPDGNMYERQYPAVTATSQNAGVATASWNNGTVTITGVSPGQTSVVITASLREYTDASPQTVQVTVGPQATSNTGAGSSEGTTPGGNATGDTAKAGAVTGGTSAGGASTGTTSTSGTSAAGTTQSGNAGVGTSAGSTSSASASASAASESSSPVSSASSQAAGSSSSPGVMTNAADYQLVQLPADNEVTQAELKAVQGTSKTVLFQKKDHVGNILYSWEFAGKDIKTPQDINLGISFSSQNRSKISKLTGGASVFYLSFAYHGKLPGKATVSVRVGNTYRDGQMLYFYYFDPEKNALSLEASRVKVVNGYANFNITHCSDYVLSARNMNDGSESVALWSILVGLVVLGACEGVLWIIQTTRKRKGKTGLRSVKHLPFLLLPMSMPIRSDVAQPSVGAEKPAVKDETLEHDLFR